MNAHPARPWALSEYSRPHLPLPIAHLSDRSFINNGTRVLDMPIRMPGQEWRVPKELEQFQEMVRLAETYERTINADLAYCYITVDQKPVKPGTTQRRPGCHGDGWIVDSDGYQIDIDANVGPSLDSLLVPLVERTYVAYDCLPTEFFAGPFHLSSLDDDSAQITFDAVAESQQATVFPSYVLLCLDPYDIHRSAINRTREPIDRTFAKVSFSNHRYNREGNTHNNLFDYDWPMVPRLPKREHRYARNHPPQGPVPLPR